MLNRPGKGLADSSGGAQTVEGRRVGDQNYPDEIALEGVDQRIEASADGGDGETGRSGR